MDISKELFERVPVEEKSINRIVRPSVTYWQDAWRRLKENKLAMLGLAIIIIIALAAIVGPWLSQYDYSTQNLDNQNVGPGIKHWFGTDKFGRDIFIRVLYGARVSLTVGFLVAIANFTIGILYGGISGYVGGWLDNLMMRIVDILISVPYMIFVILFMLIFGAGMTSIIIALAATGWVGMARIVRGQILSLKEQEFILAAKTIGTPSSRILLRHLVPNSMGPIIVTTTFAIPNAIFSEAFLSFLGLGVSAPRASWGVLANDALPVLLKYPTQLLFPALAISITLFAFQLLGDGLRDALDPKMRK